MKNLHLKVLLLLSVCVIGGCAADSPLDNYLTRLGRSLDRDIEPTGERLPPLPRTRDLKMDVQSGSIGLLDMLALRGCELSITVGKMNSSLGKLANESQRLLLELEFLSLAPSCIEHLVRRGHAELVGALQEAIVRKREQLPLRIWNATLAGQEFRDFWKRPAHLGVYPSQVGSEVVEALSRLSELTDRWLADDYRTGSDELEHLLGDIRLGDGGALLAALDLQRAWLTGADYALQERTQEASICLGKRPSPEGRIVDTVVRKFFIGEVQPWSVHLARRRTELMSPILAMEGKLDQVLPPAYEHWSTQRDQLLESASLAPREHALNIAALLELCSLSPGDNRQAAGASD